MRKANIILADVTEAYEAWAEHEPEPTVDIAGKLMPIGEAVGRLWRCRDLMPNRLGRDVLAFTRHGETPRTEASLATYSQTARIVKQRINEAKAS